jgi:hypothetical protein
MRGRSSVPGAEKNPRTGFEQASWSDFGADEGYPMGGYFDRMSAAALSAASAAEQDPQQRPDRPDQERRVGDG